MEFRILGPLEVISDSGPVRLGGPKQRALLTVLLLNANESVSAERLALALWGEEAPAGATRTVHVHVSRLRRTLGNPDLLTTTAAGYCLRVRPDELDAERFERLLDDGRRALAVGEPEHAAAVLREAQALWRGPPLADVTLEYVAVADIARLEEQRLTVLEARIEADLAAGQHASVVGELQQLVAEHPRRERLACHLMLALYRCGRQTDALDVYHDTRRVLIADVGVEPGPELRRLQEAILRQDTALESQAAVAELPPELDASAAPALVGRRRELGWLRERWERAREGAGGLVTLIGVSGSGKLRLAAELAATVHDSGDVVLYVSGSGPGDAVLTTLRRTRQTTAPTLLVIHAANRADAATLAELQALSRELEGLRVLVLACGEDIEALADLRSDGVLMLEGLDAAAVAAIARQYARGTAAEEIPAEWLLEASGGIPGVVHELASQWARREATRHVGAVARRAAAGREQLRSIQAELAGGVEDLQEVRQPSAPPRWEVPVMCPFKGLASFDVADAPYFFGREKLIAELVARLVGAQLLGIVGPSGSGKSSVTRAGLLPALASGVLPGSDAWRRVLIRPGEHPLRELTEAMETIGDRERAVVAIDQFEETFTICEDEAQRAAFIAELGRMASQRDNRLVVVVVLRADFYGRCADYSELADRLASNHVLVGSMQRDELRRAIELPAQRVGLRVDPELADALVADVKDEPGALPLLSTALLELWQHRDGRRLRYTVYQQSGGVRGAVARLAEAAFAQLDGEQQVVARGVLMRLAGEGAAGGVERRRVAMAELEIDRSEDVAHVVALLTDRRLLTASSGTIELAHEALLREWPRLRDWIDADREGLRIHRNLNAAARAWEALDRDDGALYRGARLTEATDWNKAQQPRLNETERSFLVASEAARQRDRTTRRRRIALAFGSLMVALLAISVLAVVSIVQGRKTASRELANRSDVVIAGDPGLALAIGLEAVRRSETTEAQNAVRQATFADRATAVVRVSPKGLNHAALSFDASLVAAAGEDGSAHIVNLRSGRVASTLKMRSRAQAIDVSFSPDARHIASVSVDGEVAITDLARQRRRVVKLRSGVYATSVEYEPSGRRLLIAAYDGTIRLFNVSDLQSRVLAKHPAVRVARFDPVGTRVLSADRNGDARIFNLAGGATKSLRHGAEIYDACWSHDGRLVATAGADGAVRIWNSRTGQLLQKLAIDLQPLYSVQFSTDGHRLVTAGKAGVVRVSDVTGEPVLAELKGHREATYSAGFAGDAKHVYSAGADGTVRTWAVPKTAILPSEHNNEPFWPSFSPDRELVVSGFRRGGVRLWNPDTGASTRLPGHSNAAAAVYSANGAYILSWSIDGTVRLRDIKRGTSSFVRAPADGPALAIVIAAAIDPTGRRIAIAAQDERAVLQAPDGADKVTLPDHGRLNWLAFSPDGKHLVTASADGTARTWNARSGARERVLKVGTEVLDARYSPNGERVAAAGADGIIRIWALEGGDPTVLYGHDGPVNALGFNDAGNRIVSGGSDGTVRVWDTASGDPLVVLHQHKGSVSGVAFSANGQEVISGADDGIRLSTCEVCGAFPSVLALARTRPEVTLTAAERRRLGVGGG